MNKYSQNLRAWGCSCSRGGNAFSCECRDGEDENAQSEELCRCNDGTCDECKSLYFTAYELG